MTTPNSVENTNEAVISANRPESLLQFGTSQRLPIIVQTEVAECGLTCLAMVAGFYGFDTDMASLRNRFSISSHGTNLKQLMEMSGKLYLSTRALKLEITDLPQS
ncbi:MAG: cysteine peptidase family C39 domain-containing protein [Thalassotalea sp.]